jgi:hypothetical protein
MVTVEVYGRTLNEYYELVRQAKCLGQHGQDFEFEYVAGIWDHDNPDLRHRHLKFYFYNQELAVIFKLKYD